MNNLVIKIIQGSDHEYPPAHINIVIDVIRAFTVSHLAFLRGVREIILVNTVEEAWTLKRSNPDYLLAGEIGGLAIENFELDNSPYTFSQASLENRTVVQKTSNGVKATLQALNAELILVTGLSNAMNTARYAKQWAAGKSDCIVNIIASHAGDDDDLACAEYLRELMLEHATPDLYKTMARIRASRPAQKFFDPAQTDFDVRDMDFCTREVGCDFVMKVVNLHSQNKLIKTRMG
jgi:2-phosphosulfolactate phosphatase